MKGSGRKQQSDRDQAPYSAEEAYEVAEQAEEASQRALGDGDAPPESMISGDNLKPSGGVDPADKLNRIAERAYFKAERRGFTPGYEDADWLEAEREINIEMSE
jgi:hypothetical protein